MLAPRLRALAGAALIFVVTALVYLPSLRGGFVLDDDAMLTDNPLIKAPDGPYRFWFTSEPVDYWPVIGTSFWLEWRLWKTNPTGYRVTNLVLHIAAALLIWTALRRVSLPGAFLAALLFAVHPVNVQSVAWITQRKNLLAMLFLLLSTLSFLRSESHPPPRGRGAAPLSDRWYWSSLAAFLFAMLSKGSAAVLPPILLGIIRWSRPLTARDLARAAPFFLICAVLIPVNIWFQARAMAPAAPGPPPIERLLGAAGVVWFYLSKALLPLHLCFVYPKWHVDAGRPRWWLPLLAAVALTAALWRFRHGWSRPILAAWGFFCVALVPVMGFTLTVFMVEQSLVADHYQHIALIGVVALVAAGWATWRQRTRGWRRWIANATAVGAAAALAVLTWQQSRLYADGVRLFQAAAENAPGSALAQHNLAFALARAGRLPEAVAHYREALRLEPDYAQAHGNLGAALALSGRRDQAIQHYQQALALAPDDPATQNDLGAMLRESGHPDEAIAHFERALRIRADFPEAHFNLGKALLEVGRHAEAIEHLRKAVQLRPDLPDAQQVLTAALQPR